MNNKIKLCVALLAASMGFRSYCVLEAAAEPADKPLESKVGPMVTLIPAENLKDPQDKLVSDFQSFLSSKKYNLEAVEVQLDHLDLIVSLLAQPMNISWDELARLNEKIQRAIDAHQLKITENGIEICGQTIISEKALAGFKLVTAKASDKLAQEYSAGIRVQVVRAYLQALRNQRTTAALKAAPGNNHAGIGTSLQSAAQALRRS